ncbi:APOBEC1 complementation factor [Nymphon striatum]|nr:APOBEC1 complementation factor [Nymphon striatum]
MTEQRVKSKEELLLALTQKTGYEMGQENGQRKYGGPPPNWEGPPPPKGCEIFIGKIPRDCFEDELVPVFETVGEIYELRLMMDFSGTNRGYAFVMYKSVHDSKEAVRRLDNYEIRKGRFLGVCKSVDNCRLFVGGIPKNKTREEVKEAMGNVTEGVVNVILYASVTDKSKSRGFAFVEYESHRAAAMARRKLIPGKVELWNHEIAVDWAEPEPEIDEEIMKKVTILYIRNLMLTTTEDQLKEHFSLGGAVTVEKVKKLRDFAFIHYKNREDAEKAQKTYHNQVLDGAEVEVTWAKPVDRSNRNRFPPQQMQRTAASNTYPQPLSTFGTCVYPPPQFDSYGTTIFAYPPLAPVPQNQGRNPMNAGRQMFRGRGRGAAGLRNNQNGGWNAGRGFRKSAEMSLIDLHPSMELIPTNPYTLKPNTKTASQILHEVAQKHNWGDPIYSLHSVVNPEITGGNQTPQLFLFKVTFPNFQTIFTPTKLTSNIDEAKQISSDYVLMQCGISVDGEKNNVNAKTAAFREKDNIALWAALFLTFAHLFLCDSSRAHYVYVYSYVIVANWLFMYSYLAILNQKQPFKKKKASEVLETQEGNKTPGMWMLLRLGRRTVTGWGCRCQSTATQAHADPTSEAALSSAKPFKEVPGPKPIPVFGNKFRYFPVVGDYDIHKFHDAQVEKFKKYGNIVSEAKLYPGQNLVHLFDPKDLETMYRIEGKYPVRDFFKGMAAIRKSRPDLYHTAGVAAGNGEEWYDMRSKSQQPMLRPKLIQTYLPQINLIVNDFIARIKEKRDDKLEVNNLTNDLFKWALESVAFVMLNKRMGCLAPKLASDSEPQTLINCVNDFFELSAKVELGLPIWRYFPSLSPSYKKLEKVHILFSETALKHINAKVKEIENRGPDEESDESVLESLIQRGSVADATIMVVDAFAGGIDTTSFASAYFMYNLARNPEVQKKLQEEVDEYAPNNQELTMAALNKMRYLKACIKESFRITPIVQGTSRTLPQDTVLSGYKVPKGTIVTMNHYVPSVQEECFPEPLKFKPERWLKTSEDFTAGSFAFQPFGFGPRMCIGRRIAELELYSLFTKLMQNFTIEYKYGELDIVTRLVLMINSPLKFTFNDRKK